MAIITHLDVVLAIRKMTSKELASRIGLSENNLSRIKTGNIKAIRWTTLEAICRELDCQPGDILEFVPDPETAPAVQAPEVREETAPVTAKVRKAASRKVASPA